VLVQGVDGMSIQEVAMRFGEIIQKAWKLTWRFRYLWVLAIFAGITGPSGGGGGNFNSGSGFPSDSGGSSSGGDQFGSMLYSSIGPYLPVIIAALVIWIVISLAWAIIGVGARGGLIWAVDEIETGRVPALGQAWNVGFSRFWSLLGVSLLLGLPVLVLLLVLAAAVIVPIALVAGQGGSGGAEAAAVIAPVCGVLVIGVPLLIVLGVVLGFMKVIAHRSIILEGAHAFDAASGAWRIFRARIKDSLLMWIISWGLSIAAGVVLAIPLVIVTVAIFVPAMIAGFSGNWGVLVGAGAVWLLIVLVVAFVFTAIWGTFTSALWTIFYRRLVGREVLPPTVMPNSPQPPAYVPPSPPQYSPQPYPTAGFPTPPAPPSAAEPYTPPTEENPAPHA
jgi:hypothetical protein